MRLILICLLVCPFVCTYISLQNIVSWLPALFSRKTITKKEQKDKHVSLSESDCVRAAFVTSDFCYIILCVSYVFLSVRPFDSLSFYHSVFQTVSLFSVHPFICQSVFNTLLKQGTYVILGTPLFLDFTFTFII